MQVENTTILGGTKKKKDPKNLASILNPATSREDSAFHLVDRAKQAQKPKTADTSGVEKVLIPQTDRENTPFLTPNKVTAKANAQDFEATVKAAQDGETVRPAEWSQYEQGVQDWEQEVKQVASEALQGSERRDGVWQDKDIFSDYLEQQTKTTARLLSQASQYKNFFESHRDVYGGQGVDGVLSALDSGQKSLRGASRILSEEEKFRGQFADEAEYSTYNRLRNYEKLRDNPDFSEKSQYVSTYLPGTEKFNAWSGIYTNSGFGDIDYDYINRNETAMGRYSVNSINNNSALLGLDSSERLEMTADEIAIFNYLYAQDEAAGDRAHTNAYQYVKDLTGQLNYRQRQSTEQQWRDQTKQDLWGNSAFSILMSPVKGLSYLGQIADYAADGTIDQNAGYNKFSYIPTAIRAQGSEDIANSWAGDPGSFLYGTGMSIGDFALNSALTGGLAGGGKAAGWAALGLMGAGAAADTVIDKRDQGYDDTRSIVLGTAAGLAEIVTEKISLEALLDKTKLGRSAFGYFVKNVIAEGSEEGASDLLNWAADELYDVITSQDDSEWKRAVREKGTKAALLDRAKEIGLDMLGGALSGGVMAGAGIAFDRGQNMASGRQNGGLVDDVVIEQAAQEVAAREMAQNAAQEAAQAPAPQAVQNTAQVVRTAQEASQGASEDAQRTRADTEIVGRDDSARRSAGSGPVTDGAPSGRALQTDTAARDITAQQRTAAMENASALVRASEVFGENGRKAFAAAWDGQTDSARYYAGFSTWYQAGLDGKAESQVRGPYAGSINEAQRLAAYNSGQRDAELSLAREKAAAPYARTAGTEAGLVYDEYVAQAVEGEGGKLTADTAERMNQAAKALGVRVRLVDHIDAGTTGANGDIRGSEILIAKDAVDPVAQVYGHEITHRVQELAPEQYRVFRQAALENLADSAVQAKLDNYRAQGENLLYEKAMDDVAADYAGRLLEDGAVLDQFIEHHREDRTLLERLRDVFRSLWQKLTGAERRKAQTAEGKLAAALDAAAEQAKTLTETGEGQGAEGDVKYSLKEFKDGRRFVDVDTDQAQFDGLTTLEMQAAAKKVIMERFRGKVIGDEYTAYVDRMSAKHYAYPANRRMDETQKRDKMRASPELDNLLAASTFKENVPDDGRHPMATGGLDKLETLFRVNGRIYKADITVLVTDHGRVFYDMTQFNDITGRETGLTQSAAETSNDAVKDSVPQSGGESKPQYSLKGTTITKTYNQLLRENDALRERLDYWRGQTRQTKEVTVDKKAVNAAAKDIVKEYGAQLDAGELSGRLQALYDHMARTWYDKGETEGSDVWKGAEEIAKDIAGSAVKEFSLAEEFPGLKEKLRDTPITIGHEYDNDLHNENFRRDYRGKLKLSSQGPTNVDAVYAELSESYPGLFPEDITHPADQMEQIMDVVDSLSSVERQDRFSGQMDAAVMGITNEIVDKFLGLDLTEATFADRQAAKLDKLRADKNMKLEELRTENKQAVRDAIAKERAAREKQVNELKDKYKARTEEDREKQSAAELRRKITRHAKGLSDKLLRPTDKAHIPEELRGPVAKVLESINLESQYTVDPETGKRTKGGSGDPVKRTQAFLELKQKYAEINKNGGDLVIDPALLGSDTEGVQGSLDAVIAMGDTRIAAMNSKQLSTVWQVLKSVEHSVSTAGKLLNQGKYQRTAEWADALRQDTATRRKRTGDGRLRLDLENPYTYFSHYGQAGKDMYRTLRNAQDHQQVLTNRVADGVSQVVDEKTAKKLEKTSHDYTTENGQKLTLSTAQVMELYELSKRKQARDHLLIGGIVQPEIRGTKVRRGTEAIRLTVNDLADITGTLTAEEKGIADGLQKIASTLLSDMGNEASMAAYGYKKFTEPDYWPIRSAREGLHSNIEKGGDNSRSIKNIGMAQATVPHANNQVDIGSIFDTFARHTGDMVDYAAWVVPMEDLNRVYNYQYRDGEGNPTGKTVKGLLDEKGGEGAQKYWQDLMEDIQNGIKGKNDSAFAQGASKLIGGFKGSAVGGNIRVIIQQPTAFFRAAAVLSPADMTAGLAKGATKGFGWQKAKQYSPIAMRKDAGGFDISSPGTMKETLFGSPGVVNKVNDFMGLGAGVADALTWGKLWNACEWQVARQHKELEKGSNAFYEEVNRVFTDMVDQTQVVDGILQRSNIMRSSNAMVQQATSFMGEPIMSLNLTMRAWDQLRNEQDSKKRGKAIKNFGRAVTALTVTAAVNAVAQSLVDAMRDDDKDKKYWERFKSAFTGQTGEEESPWDKAWAAVMEGNFGSNLNPAGQIPYVKDVLSIFQGYDVSRTELSVVQDLIEAGQSFVKSADGTGPRTVPYALNKLLTSGAKVFGIPAANLERDIWALGRSIVMETGNLPLQYEMEKAIYNIGSEKNKSRFEDIMYRALEAGEMDTYAHIQQELMEQMGLSGKDVESAMQSRYKARVEDNPGYTLPDKSYDLLGIRPQVSGGDDGDSAFGPGDLDAAAYQAYATQRAEDYREAQTALSGSPIFRGMDQETQDTVLRAAYDLAQSGAMMDNGGGEYEYPSSWLAQAPDVEAQGIEPWEYALWRGAQSSITDTKGADGKTVKGQSKKDHLVDWLEGSGLSADQQEYLWGTAYTTDYDEYRDELAEYRSYGPQMDAAYEEMSSGLADNPIFTDMDAELREKVTNAALEASEQMAKMEAVDGYEYETQWIAKTGEAEDRGIAPEDYVMWHVVCGNTYSDRDANGNEIPGQRKQDHLRAWLRGNVALSESQKLWLWRQQYKSLPF